MKTIGDLRKYLDKIASLRWMAVIVWTIGDEEEPPHLQRNVWNDDDLLTKGIISVHDEYLPYLNLWKVPVDAYGTHFDRKLIAARKAVDVPIYLFHKHAYHTVDYDLVDHCIYIPNEQDAIIAHMVMDEVK